MSSVAVKPGVRGKLTANAPLAPLVWFKSGGAAETLFYGPLSEALDIAAAQPEEVQQGLFLATDNDVVAYLDLIAE